MKALWNRFADTARAQDACAASCCAASHFILGIISDAGFLSGSAVALKIFSVYRRTAHRFPSPQAQ